MKSDRVWQCPIFKINTSSLFQIVLLCCFIATTVISIQAQSQCTAAAGTLGYLPEDNSQGLRGTVKGAGWKASEGANRYEIFLDDQPTRVIEGATFFQTCDYPDAVVQPNFLFTAPPGLASGQHTFTCKLIGINSVVSATATFTVTSTTPPPSCQPTAGTLSTDATMGIPGATVNITGSGWMSGANTQYQVLFNGLLFGTKSNSGCSDQPNLSFDIPCATPPGTYSIICQLVDSTTQQILKTSLNTPDFTVTQPIGLQALAICQAPTVQIKPFKLIPKDSFIMVQVILNPSPSNIPVTLTLSRNDKKGKETPSGKAVFKRNNSQELEITESQIVEISGIEASSNENNMELKAIIKNGSSEMIVAQQNFTVLWVTIEIRTGSADKKDNKLSNDNSARQAITKFNNTDELGLHFIDGDPKIDNHVWATVVEFVGKVTPSDYTGQIVLQRILVEKLTYADKRLLPQLTETNKPDTSFPKALDIDPQSGGSTGIVYDTDSPGVAILPSPNSSFSTIARQRRNFIEFATTPDLLTEKGSFSRVSDLFLWFNRVSVIRTPEATNNEFNNAIEHSIPEDNKAGKGKTNTTWDLK